MMCCVLCALFMQMMVSAVFPFFLVALIGAEKQSVSALISSTSTRHQPIHMLPIQKGRIKERIKLSIFSSSHTGAFITEINEPAAEELAQELDPLRPPSYLASLRVGESYEIPIMDADAGTSRDLSITRLSCNPDIFLVPKLIVKTEYLMDAAITQGLKVAGTRKNQSNSIRTHSYTTWLGNDKNDVEDNDLKFNPHRCYTGLVQGITGLCKSLFVHESLLLSKAENRHQQQQQSMFVAAEDMQIAKYDAGGSFHLHHDGFSRFLTVLTYLNGVGGTYFPLARTKQSGDSSSNHDDLRQPPKLCMNDDGSLSSKGYVVGTDGLLIVGKEGAAAYLDNENAVLLAENRSAIASIQAGDAVVFYNYNLSKKIDTIASNGIRDHGRDDREDDAGHNKEWRAVHAALPAPREKWIATNWFRSQELTGPFAHLYRESLLSDTDTDTGTDLLAIR